MIIAKQVFEDMINSPRRSFKGRVEVFEGSTLTSICACHDNLMSFTVERTGEKDKFFGYGVCQKLTVNLRDKNRQLNITKNHSLEVEFGVGADYLYPCPKFFVEDITRNENTNELTVVAYDALYKAAEYKLSDLSLPASYSIAELAMACAILLGIPMERPTFTAFETEYPNGANFNGDENLREVMDAIAEATQTIYYVDRDWKLVFKRLDIAGEPVAIIDKSKYMTLTNSDAYALTNITHATELGDNVSASTGAAGAIQYIRDNPLWEMRNDIGSLVDNALAATAGLTLTNFDCSWRGNFLLEIGDKIGFITKDDELMVSYLLDDSFTFNGGLSGKTQYSYTENKTETPSNPTTIGEALKQTYARVDKTNQQIDLVASKTDINSQAISALQVNTDAIVASVSTLRSATEEAIENVSGNIATLNSKVEAQITSEDVQLQISKELANGTSKVITSTGFTFDEAGLTVKKTNSEMKTTISEDGMKVFRNEAEVLTADNTGVNAVNLKASTYLIIGTRSRFENYGSNRTGCFWIGG